MTFDDSFWRALADYTLKFVDKASLGAGNPPAAWYGEYQRAGSTAFASVLLTSNSFEGASSAGAAQFPQGTLLDALHCRRFDLDNTYALPPHLAIYPSQRVARTRGNRGFLMEFKPRS